MQLLFHSCGQAVEADEAFDLQESRRGAVFQDHQTGDGIERCPGCGVELRLRDCKCQAPIARPKRNPEGVTREKAQAARLRVVRKFVATVKRRKRAGGKS